MNKKLMIAVACAFAVASSVADAKGGFSSGGGGGRSLSKPR